jgi:hypothetical protein
LTYYRVLPALNEDVPTPQLRVSDVKTYATDVNTSRAPEKGAHSPSWPNVLIIIDTCRNLGKRNHFNNVLFINAIVL